jgi:oligoendopeptidase F
MYCCVVAPAAQQAAALLSGADREKRIAAWEGLQSAWAAHCESVAAILNALAGWRLELVRKRDAAAAAAAAGSSAAVQEPRRYLAAALHNNRMSGATLDAMMTAIKEAEPFARVSAPAIQRTFCCH